MYSSGIKHEPVVKGGGVTKVRENVKFEPRKLAAADNKLLTDRNATNIVSC
jgi:hypothetical protein